MEPKSIHMFDLEPPAKNLMTAMFEPHPCRICGRERPGLSPLGRAARDHAHDSCDRQVSCWYDAADKIRDDDPEVRAVEESIQLAHAARDQLFRNKLLAAGVPEWFVNGRVDALYDE